LNAQEQILNLVYDTDPDNPLQYVRNIVKDYSIQKMNTHIRNCQDCKICNGPKSIGIGNPNATVMIIGESISQDQINDNIDEVLPFDNKAGEMLYKILDDYNVNKDELFIMNAVNCWPKKQIDNDYLTRTPTKKEVLNCSVFVNYAIETIQPQVIILLGNIALNMFRKDIISKTRGQWFKINGIDTIATYHPGFFLQIEGKKRKEDVDELKWDFYNDLITAFKFIKEKNPNSNIFL